MQERTEMGPSLLRRDDSALQKTKSDKISCEHKGKQTLAQLSCCLILLQFLSRSTAAGSESHCTGWTTFTPSQRGLNQRQPTPRKQIAILVSKAHCNLVPWGYNCTPFKSAPRETYYTEAVTLWDNHCHGNDQVPSTLYLMAPQSYNLPATHPQVVPSHCYIKVSRVNRGNDTVRCSIMMACICWQLAGDTRLPVGVRRVGKKGGSEEGTHICTTPNCFVDGFFNEKSYSCREIV